MSYELIIGLVSVIAANAAGLIVQYVKVQTTLARQEERINAIEKREETVADAMGKLTKSIVRIEMALVKAGLISAE